MDDHLFAGDRAWFRFAIKWPDRATGEPRTPELAAQDGGALRIDAVNLKNRLRDIQTDRISGQVISLF